MNESFSSIDGKEVPNVGKISANTLVLGDCLEMMAYIDDQSVDLVLADLPYG